MIMPWNGQKGYGPWNALADILGAYIQKSAIDGANEYASKAFANEPMAQAQQDVEAAQAEAQHAKLVEAGKQRQLQQQMNSGFQANAMDSLKPNIRSGSDILAEAPGANGGPSMLQMMNDFSKKNNPYLQAKPLPQNVQQDSQQPAQENVPQPPTQSYKPFEVDAGFGKKVVAKNAEEQAQDQQRIAMAQQRAEAPMSYGDYVAQMKNQRSLAMKEMIKKYGVDAAKQAQGLIDDAYNEKISAYADRMNNQGMKQLYGSLYGQTEDGQIVRKDLADRNNRINFLFNLQNYNNQAKRMGMAGFDMNVAKELLATDAVKDIQIDAGGAIHVLGQRTDGSVQEMGVIKKSLSPKDIQASKDKAADRQLKVWQTNENNRVKSAIAASNNASRERVAAMNKGSKKTDKIRKWADTLQVGQEAALAAIKSGAAFDDYDNHSVEEFRQACIKAAESGDLDDDDREAALQAMEDVMALYKDELDKRS